VGEPPGSRDFHLGASSSGVGPADAGSTDRSGFCRAYNTRKVSLDSTYDTIAIRLSHTAASTTYSLESAVFLTVDIKFS